MSAFTLVYVVLEQYPYEGAEILQIFDNDADAKKMVADLTVSVKDVEYLRPRYLVVEQEVHDSYEKKTETEEPST